MPVLYVPSREHVFTGTCSELASISDLLAHRSEHQRSHTASSTGTEGGSYQLSPKAECKFSQSPSRGTNLSDGHSQAQLACIDTWDSSFCRAEVDIRNSFSQRRQGVSRIDQLKGRTEVEGRDPTQKQQDARAHERQSHSQLIGSQAHTCEQLCNGARGQLRNEAHQCGERHVANTKQGCIVTQLGQESQKGEEGDTTPTSTKVQAKAQVAIQVTKPGTQFFRICTREEEEEAIPQPYEEPVNWCLFNGTAKDSLVRQCAASSEGQKATCGKGGEQRKGDELLTEGQVNISDEADRQDHLALKNRCRVRKSGKGKGQGHKIQAMCGGGQGNKIQADVEQCEAQETGLQTEEDAGSKGSKSEKESRSFEQPVVQHPSSTPTTTRGGGTSATEASQNTRAGAMQVLPGEQLHEGGQLPILPYEGRVVPEKRSTCTSPLPQLGKWELQVREPMLEEPHQRVPASCIEPVPHKDEAECIYSELTAPQKGEELGSCMHNSPGSLPIGQVFAFNSCKGDATHASVGIPTHKIPEADEKTAKLHCNDLDDANPPNHPGIPSQQLTASTLLVLAGLLYDHFTQAAFGDTFHRVNKCSSRDQWLSIFQSESIAVQRSYFSQSSGMQQLLLTRASRADGIS